jgi:LacI family gluconate utilization system Gnt-I transcriptional repressor
VSEDKRKRRGAGRVTLNTVARHAQVSAITVSRYFNQPDQVSPERRERIKAAVDELGYVPNLVAGGLASARGRIVGMVIPNISGPIFASTIQGFSDTLSRHGYQLLLASSYFSAEQEESAVRAFLGWSPAALVLTSHFHSEATEKMIAEADIPARAQPDPDRLFPLPGGRHSRAVPAWQGLPAHRLRAEQRGWGLQCAGAA